MRYYFALTNFCNRACPLCSCHSDPYKTTFLSDSQFYAFLTQPYEIQLEGGEPLLHPNFYAYVKYVEADPLCQRVILCTNGDRIPWKFHEGKPSPQTPASLSNWLSLFAAKPFTLKPSINQYLVDRDTHLLSKLQALKEVFEQVFPNRETHQLVFDVRVNCNKEGQQLAEPFLAQAESLGLLEDAAVYSYQKYGKAEAEEGLAKPFIIANPVQFELVSPDGETFGMDLEARANWMKKMR